MSLDVTPTRRAFPPPLSSPAILGTVSADGGVGLAPVDWHMPVSREPPLYGVALSPPSRSHRTLIELPCFSLAFLPATSRGLMAALEELDGSPHDPIRSLDLTVIAGQETPTSLLADSWLAYECRVEERVTLGDRCLWVGRVVAAHRNPSWWDDGGLAGAARPLLRLGERLYAEPTEARGPVDAEDRG